jgi:hypothetical protein
VPPAQCPECGRFLARAFVQNLATEPADCPKCGLRLSSAHFPEELGQAAAPDAPAEEPAGAAELRDPATPDPDPASVRPPDLDPGQVRAGEDGQRDPLEGWDRPGADVVELDTFRAGRQPPPDGAIVAGTGLAGALVGLLVSRRRGAGASLGLLLGILAAALARQVWRLPD